MIALCRWAGSFAGLLCATPLLLAQTWASPVYCRPYLTAPDALGPGFYVVNPYGMVYGPNHYVYPPFWPVGTCSPATCARAVAAPQGPPGTSPMLPTPAMNQPQMPAFNAQTGKIEFPNPGPPNRQQYPTHPFVRSPRDYFMWNEALEEQEGRSARPAFVP